MNLKFSFIVDVLAIFGLAICFGYFKKIGNKFWPSSGHHAFKNMAWMVISTKVKRSSKLQWNRLYMIGLSIQLAQSVSRCNLYHGFTLPP